MTLRYIYGWGVNGEAKVNAVEGNPASLGDGAKPRVSGSEKDAIEIGSAIMSRGVDTEETVEVKLKKMLVGTLLSMMLYVGMDLIFGDYDNFAFFLVWVGNDLLNPLWLSVFGFTNELRDMHVLFDTLESIKSFIPYLLMSSGLGLTYYPVIYPVSNMLLKLSDNIYKKIKGQSEISLFSGVVSEIAIGYVKGLLRHALVASVKASFTTKYIVETSFKQAKFIGPGVASHRTHWVKDVVGKGSPVMYSLCINAVIELACYSPFFIKEAISYMHKPDLHHKMA